MPPLFNMNEWIASYVDAQKKALDSISATAIGEMVKVLRQAWLNGHQVFVFGNGGSACNASHFATDLGKGASDALGKRFKVLSINDNVGWITAIGNDYAYEDVFLRQLQNYAVPGDVVLTMSVSGNSPNLIKAVDWAVKEGLTVLALVGGKRGRLAEMAHHHIVVQDTHYGRVEDCHMGICHMLCYAFMEIPGLAKSGCGASCHQVGMEST